AIHSKTCESADSGGRCASRGARCAKGTGALVSEVVAAKHLRGNSPRPSRAKSAASVADRYVAGRGCGEFRIPGRSPTLGRLPTPNGPDPLGVPPAVSIAVMMTRQPKSVRMAVEPEMRLREIWSALRRGKRVVGALKHRRRENSVQLHSRRRSTVFQNL